MSNAATEIADPRDFPAIADAAPEAARILAQVDAALSAATAQEADAINVALRRELAQRLDGDGSALAALVAAAPSAAVARHLTRELDAAWQGDANDEDSGVAATMFALPVVIVAALDRAGEPREHPGVLASPEAIAELLREHDALAGNRNFGIADALVGVDAIDIPQLPALRRGLVLPEAAHRTTLSPLALTPAAITIEAPRESVHLRFIVGSMLARAGAALAHAEVAGAWAMPLARELSRQLAIDGSSVVAIPRSPKRPLPAVRAGRIAQREVSAQVFAGNAIRGWRAAVGEPTAVLCAHRSREALCGGEVRLSLSSTLGMRAADGFRCPLYVEDRIGDVVRMLTDLLDDCRIRDVRFIAGVHPDLDPGTGRPLLFTADSAPPRESAGVH